MTLDVLPPFSIVYTPSATRTMKEDIVNIMPENLYCLQEALLSYLSFVLRSTGST